MEHTLSLNNRKTLVIIGISKIKSSEPSSVIIILETSSLIINGSNLSVQQLDIKQGTIEITGDINSLKYSNQVSKKFSFKNMFK